MRGYMPAAIPSFLDPFNDCGKNLGGTEIKLAFEICPLPYRVIKKELLLMNITGSKSIGSLCPFKSRPWLARGSFKRAFLRRM